MKGIDGDAALSILHAVRGVAILRADTATLR